MKSLVSAKIRLFTVLHNSQQTSFAFELEFNFKTSSKSTNENNSKNNNTATTPTFFIQSFSRIRPKPLYTLIRLCDSKTEKEGKKNYEK